MTTDGDAVCGTSADVVRRALASDDPLPGTAGFAGWIDGGADAADVADAVAEGGALVRDVLGRQPLFSEATARPRWSTDPTDLDDPLRVPAGHLRPCRGEGGSSAEGAPDRPSGAEDLRVWTLPNPPPAADADEAVAAVREAVRTSVGEVSPGGLAVAFSGGVDSSVVAAGVPDAPCSVAGFPDSHDVAAARAAADAMDRDLRVVELDHAAVERAVPKLVAATGRTNPMDVQIALPLFLVAERVAADGYDRLAVGQGADELFGGYAKVARAPEDPRVDSETVREATREVVATLPDQLERDVLTLRAAGVEPVAPLLHDRVVRAALPLSGPLLVDGDVRKVALRRAAADLVPEFVATADKKAAQYGSLAARELDRLARRAGFKRRMDDHVERYVRSLVADDADREGGDGTSGTERTGHRNCG